ncbi:hypothetical protein [Streptomyces sp. WAC 05379]|uniref:hypothetical protein n=1 Tax=Streptomyces sp. WAC 05379 TaxID=2203207 RepID=UPI00163B6D91|nr:hypothetical protein [Streptomyces sp. WAC 05379]
MSLPQQAIEREAEAAAQAVVAGPEGGGVEQAADVEEGQGTPGWLRYATVDADRRRMEQLDPATVVDRVANTLLRSLRGDPEDRSGRVRLQLARMAPQVQDIVFERLELRLPTPVIDRLLEAVEETEQAGPLPSDAAVAPLAVPGAAEEVQEERERASAEGQQEEHERAEAPRDGNRRQNGEGRTAPGGRQGQEADAPAGRQDSGSKDQKEQDADAPGGQDPARDRQESAGRQQERSQDRQEERNASGQGVQKDAADERKGAADNQKEQKDQDQRDDQQAHEETDGAQDEAAPEPGKQAGEQEARQAEAAPRQSAAPAALDWSGAEPGERSRTGGETGAARAVGDPENEEGSDDEPLGLETESTADDAEPDTVEEASDSRAADADTAPSGEDTEVDPRLFERRKRGAPRAPALTFSDGPSGGNETPETAEPETTPDSPARTEEDEAEDRAVQDVMDGMTGDQDSAADGDGPDRAGLSLGAATGTSTSVMGKDSDKERTEERQDDVEAARRDEEARAADGTGQDAAPAPGGAAGPDQLAKADEDARTQAAGAPSGAQGASEGGGRGESADRTGAEAGDKGRKDTETAAGGGKDQDRKPDKDGTEDRAGNATGQDGKDADRGTDGTQPTPTTPPSGDQDVTEGNGNATTPGPVSGPDKVSTPGPVAAPKLAPGNGPSPMAAGPQARTNAPKATEAPGSGGATGGSAGSRARPAGGKRQAARQAAKTARRNGGGGGRTASAPAPVRSGGRGGGKSAPAGGAQRKKEAPAPDVSNATPESGLATAGSLKPHQALETLKGVDSAVGRSVDKERSALRKAPPTTQRPSGSPRTVPGGPTPAAPGTYTNAKVARTEAAPGKTPEIAGEQKPEGEVPGANVPEPSWWDIALTIGAQLFGKLLKEILPLDDLIDSILGLPTEDEGLKNARVGDAPRLPLENDSDPQRTDEQGQKLDERKSELHQAGRTDAGLPMGEDQIYPDVPKETLTGKVSGGRKGAKASGPRSVSGGVPIESASAVAEHDRGPQIQAGFSDGRQKMGQERQAKDKKSTDDRKQYDADLKREVDASGKKQADARDKGRTDISDSRDQWRKEQDDKVSEIDDKKGKKYDQVRKDIKKKDEDTEKDVDKRTEDDNKKIETEQTTAEQDAEKKQNEGKDDADNWLEEAIEKLKEFFEGLKNAIKGIFEKARQIVTGLIDKFKQQVFKLIDDARNWVIDQINTFADALIALGDELLADYPAMRDKWRRTIDGARDWAVQKVNEFADALKEVAGKLLDGLCGALLAGLDVLETGLLAAVDVAESVTVGALEFGAAAVAALGEWAAIFNDIVSDPGDWISKAGAAAETGAKEHLFDEIKAAVKTWFNQKLQEIIGIPIEDFQELISGGVTVEQMAQMAWDEAVPQLPVIIGVLVVEKVVAKLIPGAGWVMAIIDALQTAWGALSEILAAFGLFMDFLKAVKSGNGALPFAKAVAAGVVALLELVYTFLIEGVGRFMGKVADRLGDMLKKLRTKKDKPGGPDAPGQPSVPNKKKDEKPKEDDPRDKDTDTSGNTDRDKPSDRPAPRKPSPDKTSRPPSKPRPGKRSSPEKKPRPSQTTRRKKRRDDDERREEGREVNAARKRARDAERRAHDKERDSRGAPTRRGPAKDTLRKDDRKRDAGRRDDRRPGTDRDRKDEGDRSRDRDRDPRNTRPEERRERDRRRDTGKDREQDRKRPSRIRRARQTVKSAANRARRAARKLYGKARRRIGGRLNDRLRRLRDLLRKRRDRMRDDRSRRRPGRDRRRDRRDGGTESINLPKLPYTDADDGERHTLMFHGRGMDAGLYLHSIPEEVPAFLADWRADIDQQEPSPERENQETYVKAAAGRYNRAKRIQKGIPSQVKKEDRDKYRPREKALRKIMADFAYVARLREYNDIPEPKWPDFYDVASPRGDGGHVSEYLGTSAKTAFGGPGEIARKAKAGQPPGWSYITKNGLGENSAWVRMHLLPERLGGKATGNNLVPARGPQTNTLFLQNIEDQAYQAIPRQEKIIWYKAEARFGFSRLNDFVDFPSYISAAYGGYEKVRGTGKSRGDWTKNGVTKQFGRNVFPPRQDEGGILFINSAGRTTIAGMLECSTRLAGHVMDARDAAGGFKDRKEIKPLLRQWKRAKGGNIMPGLEGMLPKLDALIAQGKVELSG